MVLCQAYVRLVRRQGEGGGQGCLRLGQFPSRQPWLQSVFFCERSWLRRALRKAQYNGFESSFVNRMATNTLKPKKKLPQPFGVE
jgi:hypothetical protein